MSCCGQSRARAAAMAGGSRVGTVPPARRPTLRPLEYVGPTAFTVLGPATGRTYRFPAPGARLAVDPRDWAALARLPHLRPA